MKKSDRLILDVQLLENFIEDTTMIMNAAYEKYISVIKANYEDSFSTYFLMNKYDIIQKIEFAYVLTDNPDENIQTANEIKITDEFDKYLSTPYNINNESSYIYFYDIKDYLDWFSNIDRNYEL